MLLLATGFNPAKCVGADGIWQGLEGGCGGLKVVTLLCFYSINCQACDCTVHVFLGKGSNCTCCC